MSIDKFLKLISSLPNWINWIFLYLNILKGAAYGRSYLKYKKGIKNESFNDNKLLEIVNYAIENVPYYHEKYKRIYSMDEFNALIEYIEKEIVINSFDQFLSNKTKDGKFIEGTTSGTSGKPLDLILPANRYVFELATMHSMWQRIGWNYNRFGVISVRYSYPKNIIYRINPITREIYFDGNRLNKAYFLQIFEVLKRFNIKYIRSYPSIAYQMACIVRDEKLDISFFEGFLCSSEPIFEYQRRLIVDQLKLKFYCWYGHSEKLVLGGFCEHTTNYHLEPTYGYVELIDNNGNQITKKGEIGEIVGTTYHNRYMPLIRFRTGDYAEYVSDKCEKCGRKGLIVRDIQGWRDSVYVYRKDNSFFDISDLDLPDEYYNYMDGIQFIQNEKGSLEVIIVKNDLYKDEHLSYSKSFYKNVMGNNSKVKIIFKDQILREPSGKCRVLKSNIIP